MAQDQSVLGLQLLFSFLSARPARALQHGVYNVVFWSFSWTNFNLDTIKTLILRCGLEMCAKSMKAFKRRWFTTTFVLTKKTKLTFG